MDILTLAMAKAYTDSKQLASVEYAPRIEWDGNTAGKAEYYGYGEMGLFKVSDTPMDLNKLTRIVVSSQNGDNEAFWQLGNANHGQIANYADPEWGVTGVGAYVYSVTEEFTYRYGFADHVVPVGLYVYSNGTEWVSLLQFGEDVIHPIDPKYLPEGIGGGLPVVELSTTLTQDASLTAEENAKLKTAWENGSMVGIKCGLLYGSNDIPNLETVWGRVDFGYGFCVFMYCLGKYLFQLMSTDSGETWMCMVSES